MLEMIQQENTKQQLKRNQQHLVYDIQSHFSKITFLSPSILVASNKVSCTGLRDLYLIGFLFND